MARIRFVKPEFFSDAKLVKIRPITRLFYIGLFTQTDREGRFLWNEDDLKVKLIPYDKGSATECLQQLADIGRIIRYGKKGEYGFILNFLKHQYINPREPASKIPPFENNPIPVSYQTDTKTLDKGLRIKDKGERGELKNSLSYLEKIPDQDTSEFIARFEMTKNQLFSKAESFALYCKSHGKKYKDYKSALLNAVKSDFPERKIAPPVAKPKEPEKIEIPDTPEEAAKRKKTLDKMRKELQGLGVLKKI